MISNESWTFLHELQGHWERLRKEKAPLYSTRAPSSRPRVLSKLLQKVRVRGDLLPPTTSPVPATASVSQRGEALKLP